jgi:hypothetical protein
VLFRIIAAVTLVLAASVAEASFPPKTFTASRAEMARACGALGHNVSTTAWDYKPGEYGCVDLRSGHVTVCQPDGTCKLYFRARAPKSRFTISL